MLRVVVDDGMVQDSSTPPSQEKYPLLMVAGMAAFAAVLTNDRHAKKTDTYAATLKNDNDGIGMCLPEHSISANTSGPAICFKLLYFG